MPGAEPVRICMWSGPRNISTAMMRAFENRLDTVVTDEPFYAAYLAATGADHPMRAAVLAAQPNDWRDVARGLLGPVPDGHSVFYQKHMTHHLLPGFGRDWMRGMRHAFLIRVPEAVLRSYIARRQGVTLEDIGFRQQAEIFDFVCDMTGQAPLVIDAADVLADPRAALGGLCAALGIPFSARMLQWPAGRRGSDGVWAPAWYGAVEASTGFAAPGGVVVDAELDDGVLRIAEAAWPFYARLAAFKG